MVLAVSPGERIIKSIVLHNTTSEDQNVKVYWEDFKYQPPYEGTKEFLPSGTDPRSAGRWVSFLPSQFTLPAHGQQKITYTFSVPGQLDGGHYGVLFFERDQPVADVSGVKVVTRVGCLFFIEPKDRIKTAAVGNIRAAANGLSGDLTNQGNVVLIPRMTYYVMDEASLVADRGEIKKLYVPPGATAQWQLTLPPDLKAGNYSVVVNTDLEEGEVVVKEIELMRDASGQMTIQNVKD